MNYIKSLFSNFLVVFFANHILPGIDVIDQTKLPHLGGDLPFALVLGLVNSLIYPLFRLFHKTPSISRIGFIALILNFSAYALLKFVPVIGIRVSSIEGYILAALLVAFGSLLTNFWEMRHAHKKHEPLVTPPDDPLKK